jgi:hypothetical protein
METNPEPLQKEKLKEFEKTGIIVLASEFNPSTRTNLIF